MKHILFISALLFIGACNILASNNNIHIQHFNGRFYIISVRKCPGFIAGECMRDIGLLTQRKPNRFAFYNANYNVKRNDTIILFNDSFRDDFLFRTNKELYNYSSQNKSKIDIKWFQNVDTLLLNKSKRIFYYSASHDSIYLISMKLSTKAYNDIFYDRIQLRCNSEYVNIGIPIRLNSKNLKDILFILERKK